MHKYTWLAACLCLTACGPDQAKRYDKPLLYEQAVKKDIDFPLPASSHDIYYGMFAEWQEYTRIVRFEAPVEDCIKHIATVIAWNDATYKRTSSYPRLSVTNVETDDAGSLKPAPWFTHQKIAHGIYSGTNASHTPQIWVDVDKGVFYFRETD